MKRTKGFTLIELLAVLVILSVILLISIPQVSKFVDKAREKGFKADEDLMEKAAKNYVAGESIELPSEYGQQIEVPYGLLVNNNYMTRLYSPYTNEECVNSNVIIQKVNDIKYNYVAQLNCGEEYASNPVDPLTDETNPSMSMAPNEATESVEWLNVILDPSDDNSGIEKYRYAVSSDNGSTWTWYDYVYGDVNTTVFLNETGMNQIKTELHDFAGNVEQKTSGNYNVDSMIRFANTNPADGATVAINPTFRLEYVKANVDKIIITINNIDYYVYGTEGGSTSTKVLRTCKEIKLANSGAGSGLYYIRPINSTFRVYCDMSSEGRMLLDDFTHFDTVLGTYTNAIGGVDINGPVTLSNAGWVASLGSYTGYSVVTTYLQMYSGSGTGYIQKMLPSYANKVSFTWGNWYTAGNPAYAKIDGGIVSTLSANAGATTASASYNVGDILRFEESNGAFWVNNIWVWENENNLGYSVIDADRNLFEYSFMALVNGENTYKATIVFDDASTYSTETRTITKN